MSNERPDDFQAWRSLLGQPDALPEQGLADKDATWDRLFERLVEKPRRRWPVYGIIAACILLALVPAARFFQDRPVRTVSRHTKAEPIAPTASVLPARRRTLPPSSAAISKRPVRTSLPTARLIRPATPGPVRAPLSSLRLAAVGHTANPPEITPALAPAKLAVRPDPPARTAWKVVNLNELNTGFTRPHSLVNNRNPRPLRLGLGNPAGNDGGPPAPPDEAPALKIKFSSQN